MAGRTRRPRWRDENKDGLCDNCGVWIDDCRCVCPYCGETNKCDCVIGLLVATGGG